MDRVYLVGFMGAGKTRVGRELASRLGWFFVDMDQEIENAEGISVRQIFEQRGEPHFRQLEREHLKRLSSRTRVVVALGGGAYIDLENRLLADSTGTTVWLKVSFDNVVHRVTIDGTRPLFASSDQAKRLYEDRIPVYALAQVHVLTDGREPGDVADEIVERTTKL